MNPPSSTFLVHSSIRRLGRRASWVKASCGGKGTDRFCGESRTLSRWSDFVTRFGGEDVIWGSMATDHTGAKLTCSLHPGKALVLHSEPPYLSRDFVCDLCFKIGEGPTYHCKACKYDLHPACATLQPTLRSCAHAHPLTLQPAWRHGRGDEGDGGVGGEKRRKVKKCDGCRVSLGDSEWSYRCEACDFDVHARCAKLRERIITSFHPFPLKLLLKSPYPPRHLQCDLCDERMPTHGWVYHCTNCKFDLHPSCALLPRDPLCSAHPHRLSVCGYRTYHGKSYVCDVCLEFGGELGFRCDKCNFNIHPKCLKALFLPNSPSGGEGGEGTGVHGCNMPSPVPKFKLTAYGVHILRNDVDTKSASST